MVLNEYFSRDKWEQPPPQKKNPKLVLSKILHTTFTRMLVASSVSSRMMHEVKMTVMTEVLLPQVCFRFNTTNKSGTNHTSKRKIQSVFEKKKKKKEHKYTKTLGKKPKNQKQQKCQL